MHGSLKTEGQTISPVATAVEAVLPSRASVFDDETDLAQLLDQFLLAMLALADAQAGAVRVFTDDGRQLRMLAQRGLPQDVLAQERLVPHDCGCCGGLADDAGLAWVKRLSDCRRRAGSDYFGKVCQRVLAVALRHGSEQIGVFNLFFHRRARLTAGTESMCRMVGQLLGLALHNARVERKRLHRTVMKERQDMVNELHDAIAQTLAYAKMRLPLLNDAIVLHDEAWALKIFADVKKAVGDAHDSLRGVMTCFKSKMDPMGLLHALQGIAEAYTERSGIPLTVHNTVSSLNLAEHQEIQVFYIVQEALTNIAKHSGARHASLSITHKEGALAFIIEDDGQGLARQPGEDASAQHLGMGIMASRAQRLGASLRFEPGVSGGTRVVLVMPVTAAQETFE